MITDFHSKYYAHLLTKRVAWEDPDKLGQSLLNATVDLNPHQIDAALFAFRSPLSRGALLADEVGLGKTIEAALIISQLWVERRRRILIIVPTTLRKQWAQELAEKFFLPVQVLDTPAVAASDRRGDEDVFNAGRAVLICSYHFVRAHEERIRRVAWDVVVIDEAHRLRNVYRQDNKIARAIRNAVQTAPKVLLTATPLQNSLLELYGLVGFLDEHIFGDLQSFRAKYVHGGLGKAQFADLKERLRPICKRTLRRQVLEYVRYTKRIPITQDFTPSTEEQQLYDRVSEYLQRDELFALPASQRKLMTLILRKLLASSTFAIAGTLGSLLERLERQRDAAATADAVASGAESELYARMNEEWAEDETDDEGESADVLARAQVEGEIEDLRAYHALASSITNNAKGGALLTALEVGFAKMAELGAPRKAVIFTESRRTQEYLRDLLTVNGYDGQLVTFNGTNTDKVSGRIYDAWKRQHAGTDRVSGSKPVDIRAALIDYFRDEASIMIATEAAAEGVNLQFSSFVVNYDLPWNPQRVEQRIGRCHRYGQKHDVVVVNFLNRANEADQRVFQLLSEKFRLFDGVFGSSDEVLGALESGVDFEKRILGIYQTCRTTAEIDRAFDDLQTELASQIDERMTKARSQLLENFDEEVRERLRLTEQETAQRLTKLERQFMKLTRHELGDRAVFSGPHEFRLVSAPDACVDVPSGLYRMTKNDVDVADAAHVYRPGHALAERLVADALARGLDTAVVRFDYAETWRTEGHMALVKQLVGERGSLVLDLAKVKALEEEEHLIFAGVTDRGELLEAERCARLFDLFGSVTERGAGLPDGHAETLEQGAATEVAALLGRVGARNNRFLDQEMEKLDRWADDLKDGLERELKELDAEIRSAKKQAKIEASLETKLSLHRRAKDLEAERSRKRRALFEAQDEIDRRKESILSEVEARLKQTVSRERIFTIRWEVVG